MKKIVLWIVIIFSIFTINLGFNYSNILPLYNYIDPYFLKVPEEYRQIIRPINNKYKIPYAILVGLIEQESQWDYLAKGRNYKNGKIVSYDRGLCQINSKYQDYFLEKYWDRGEIFKVYNPEHNLYVGIAHLNYLNKNH